MPASEAEHPPPAAVPLVVAAEPFASLEPEWTALHAHVPGMTPFTHPRWHATWLRIFGATANPVFLAIRAGAQLVGVAALDLDRDLARKLGDHNVRDYGGPLVAPGHERGIAVALLDWLHENGTSRLDLWGVAEAAPFRPALAGAAAARGWSFIEEPEASCPVLELPGDWDNYLASLPKHDRHELRRKLHNLAETGDIAYSAITGRAVADHMYALFALMRASHSDKNEFLTPAMEAFFHALAREFGALGIARLGRLQIDGQLAAMVFAFETADTVYLYNSGYDPAFAHLSVGLLSKAHAVRDAIARGKRRFDFLRGEEDYKRHLGGVPRTVYRLSLRRNADTLA